MLRVSKLFLLPGESAGTLQTKVYGIVEGVPVPYPLPNPNACQDCNIKCPVTQGGSYTYKSGFKILSEYPNVSIQMLSAWNQMILFLTYLFVYILHITLYIVFEMAICSGLSVTNHVLSFITFENIYSPNLLCI